MRRRQTPELRDSSNPRGLGRGRTGPGGTRSASQPEDRRDRPLSLRARHSDPETSLTYRPTFVAGASPSLQISASRSTPVRSSTASTDVATTANLSTPCTATCHRRGSRRLPVVASRPASGPSMRDDPQLVDVLGMERGDGRHPRRRPVDVSVLIWPQTCS